MEQQGELRRRDFSSMAVKGQPRGAKPPGSEKGLSWLRVQRDSAVCIQTRDKDHDQVPPETHGEVAQPGSSAEATADGASTTLAATRGDADRNRGTFASSTAAAFSDAAVEPSAPLSTGAPAMHADIVDHASPADAVSDLSFEPGTEPGVSHPSPSPPASVFASDVSEPAVVEATAGGLDQEAYPQSEASPTLATPRMRSGGNGDGLDEGDKEGRQGLSPMSPKLGPLESHQTGMVLRRIRTQRATQASSNRTASSESLPLVYEPVVVTTQGFTPHSLDDGYPPLPAGHRNGQHTAESRSAVPEAYFSPVAAALRALDEPRHHPSSLCESDDAISEAYTLSQSEDRAGASLLTPQWAAVTTPGVHIARAPSWSLLSNAAMIHGPLSLDINKVCCSVIRHRTGKDTIITLVTEEGAGRAARCLLVARESKHFGKTEYTVATTVEGTRTRAVEDGFVGMVTSNMLGTRFAVFDNGFTSASEGHVAHRLLAVSSFNSSAVSLSGNLRRMASFVPTPITVTPRSSSTNAPAGALVLPEQWDGERDSDTISLTSRPPFERKVNGIVQRYLPFHGRCKVPSVKNFQLCYEGNDENVVLLFGKDSKDIYSMDYSWPLTAYQAFGISLSSIATKLCYAV